MKLFNSRRESAEMSMVMDSIAKTENDIQQKIFQLGKMYYAENKNKDAESIGQKYYDAIDFIRKLEENRKGFYKNKLRLEGQMQCENCGSIISYGSVFCSVCGKKADEKSEDDGIVSAGAENLKCRNCGAVLEAGSLFCSACGEKVLN